MLMMIRALPLIFAVAASRGQRRFAECHWTRPGAPPSHISRNSTSRNGDSVITAC
jgi:hypothetical protein